VVPAASVIAVLPPAPVTPDTALARLGQNLAVTLSANLNGVGDIRVIDALTVLAQTQGRAAEYTLDEGAALGRRLGATGVVSGTLARDGPNVRLDLGLYATADAAPVARAFVTASPDDINALTDSATWALLRHVWRSGAPPSPSLAALTTRSVPALRAFLEGERANVENRWPDAEQAYARAVQEDSIFWLARWRHAYARWWQMHEVDSAALAPARAHAAELPEPERLLMEAWDDDSVSAFERGRVLTKRYPDYWPGWFERADRLFHVGPFFGHPIEEARQGLERTLELNPRLKPAWNHLQGVALTERDADLQERAVRATAELGGYPGPDSVFALQDRMNLDVLRGKPFASARADSFVALTLSFRDPFLQQWSGVWFSSFGYPAMQIEFSRRVLRGGALPGTADAIRAGLAVAWAARGAWDSAMAAMDVYAAQSRDRLAIFDLYRFAVVGVWLGGLEPEAALARRAALMDRGGPVEGVKPFFAWLDGLLAVAQHDAVGLHEAKGRLRNGDQAWARSLLAFELQLDGNRRAAAESLYAMAYRPSDWLDPTFAEVNRLAAARWLAADGDLDRAAPLLLWPQANIPGPWYWYRALVLDGVTYREAAGIEAARGNTAQARKFYEEFLLRYDQPVARLRHLVEEARAALARLERRAPAEQGRRP
jgi:TolB-like protein